MARGLSIEELAQSNPLRRHLADVLRDEQRRGHVRKLSDGRWAATETVVSDFGRAFSYLGPITSTDERRASGARIATKP